MKWLKTAVGVWRSATYAVRDIDGLAHVFWTAPKVPLLVGVADSVDGGFLLAADDRFLRNRGKV